MSIDTNLTGVFNSCKAVVDSLNEGASIINVASLSAVTGFFGQANYASAKAGVVTFTKVLSKELARQKIRVNAVAPGVVDTEMGKSIPEGQSPGNDQNGTSRQVCRTPRNRRCRALSRERFIILHHRSDNPCQRRLVGLIRR